VFTCKFLPQFFFSKSAVAVSHPAAQYKIKLIACLCSQTLNNLNLICLRETHSYIKPRPLVLYPIFNIYSLFYIYMAQDKQTKKQDKKLSILIYVSVCSSKVSKKLQLYCSESESDKIIITNNLVSCNVK